MQSPFIARQTTQDKLLPIDYALHQKQGIIRANDYRNNNVIAAYSPIKNTPLGIELKVDVTEIYAPINNQLKYIFPFSLAFIFIGLFLLNWRIAPLVKKVVSSEREAKEAKKELELSLNELKNRHREINLLRDLGVDFQTCQTIENALVLIKKYGQLLLPNTTGVLYLMNAEKYLSLALYWGDGQLKESIVNVHDNTSTSIAATNTEKEFLDNFVRKNNPSNEFSPMICMPLLVQENMIGLMYIHQHHENHPHDNNLYLLASIFCEQITISISYIKLQEKLRDQSNLDPLTGLYNRRYMEETLAARLSDLKKQPGSLSIMMIDVDHFKNFNDNHGHDAGDAILISLSELIRKHVRTFDFACRFGGEEFIVILPRTPKQSAIERAKQLHERVRQLRVKHNTVLLDAVTISIGIATYPEDGEDMLKLIKAADLALYQAKNTGRDKTVIYDFELQQ
jgi:diguanylate cyclase (GGDEF)-like protein